jgi:hypothetical protein
VPENANSDECSRGAIPSQDNLASGCYQPQEGKQQNLDEVIERCIALGVISETIH